MNWLWIYDLANWVMFLLIVGLTTSVGVAGLFLLRGWVSHLHVEQNHNEIVSYFLAAVVLFYGVMVGLISVGVWEQFSNTDEKVALEAAAISAVYHDVSSFPEPERSRLQGDMRVYTRYVIEQEWPAQQKRTVPAMGSEILWKFQDDLTSFQPGMYTQSEVYGETLRAFNHLVELRDMRVHTVESGLPAAVWIVVALGALLTMSVSWFFKSRTFTVHFWMVTINSVLLGCIVWLLVVMDHPFLGDVSIGPQAFEAVYKSLMTGQH